MAIKKVKRRWCDKCKKLFPTFVKTSRVCHSCRIKNLMNLEKERKFNYQKVINGIKLEQTKLKRVVFNK